MSDNSNSDNLEKVLTQSNTGVDFEKLREMETFTKEIFNRVIAFQMKEHPAWDVNKGFSERIHDLCLHDLIFSSPDRDPEQFNHTVAPYYPLRYELRKIIAYAQQVAAAPKIIDYPCANGFIGSLLARELEKDSGEVIGLPAAQAKPNQIDPFMDTDCYQRQDDADFSGPCDVVFCSWAPSGVNLTPTMLSWKPKMIVYVFSEHQCGDESTDSKDNDNKGARQVGTKDMFDGLSDKSSGDDYALLDEWQVTRPENIMKEAWPDLTGNLKETRYTRIYIKKSLQGSLQEPDLEAKTPYAWEIDLDMATTVLQAKAFLASRGVIQ